MVSKIKRGSRGFTLIELLVVIAIISVLATLLLLQLGTARAKARDAKRIADVNQVRSAVELYFDDNGKYPATNDMNGLKPNYLVNIPADPLALSGCTAGVYNGLAMGTVNCYGYEWDPATTPTKMQVWAELEQKNTNALNSDPDINSLTWSGAGAKINGATEACTATPADCIYDLGQP